jgi:hypothetical protein
MKKEICQSCGMPMSKEYFGTNKDESKNKEFCSFCFENGKFTDDSISMEEKINKNIKIAVGMGMTKEKARALAEDTIPKLKRWKGI